jgi:hypothetical protein
MRDSCQVLDYIDWLIDNWLRNPEGQADSPATVERVFRVLENIREFILEEAADLPPLGSAQEQPWQLPRDLLLCILRDLGGYSAFLVDQGYQSSDFCTGKPPVTPQKAPSRGSFQPLCDFLRKYLESDFRKKREGEGTAWKWEEPKYHFFDAEGNPVPEYESLFRKTDESG